MFSGTKQLYELDEYTGDTYVAILDNDITSYRMYDPYGRLYEAGFLFTDIPDKYYQEYHYDQNTGNISSRILGDMQNDEETFTYDNMDRLTSWTKGNTTIDYEYDTWGSMSYKSDLGYYSYTNSNPYAVSEFETYTGNLNITKPNVYTLFDGLGMAKQISSNNYQTNIYYGPDNQRWRSNASDNVFYFDNYEEVTTNNVTRTYVYLENGILAVSDNTNGTQFYYMATDVLGSIIGIVDGSGNEVFAATYDPWGKQTVTTNTIGFRRGFTGHEMLPHYDLINMNGRLYDPYLARFLSPDNYVQMPDFSQSFNRYSYCLNNPLKYTDPDGEWFLGTLLSAFTDLIDNVVNHGFNVSQYNWNRTVNAWRIDMGMFRGDIPQIINKWTWSLPQSIIGNELGQALNFFGKVDNVTYLDGMLALSGVTEEGRAFTIGHYSFGPDGYEATWKDHLFVHEYGHYLQSLDFGPLYMHVIAGPSLISAWGITGLEHDYHWYEVDASRRGAMYFDKKYGSGKEGYTYKNPDYFDIESFERGGYSPYKNPRRNNYYQGIGNPISSSRFNIFDILSVFLMGAIL